MHRAMPRSGIESGDDVELDQIGQNIAAVEDFYLREEGKMGVSQRFVEYVSGLVGQPLFLGLILGFVLAWMVVNIALRLLGRQPFDAFPFPELQGLIGLSALLTATVVLSKQNRLARLAEQRAHLDLKVTLLTEQKAAKLIDLLEELRRDLPNVKDRHDGDALALQKAMNPGLVLAALDRQADAGLQTAAAPPPGVESPRRG
ncbi:MAG: DUF1003 domain-containing protein [Burkholderiales bacterium]|nr:DUF1003 domain-containing protein [Burkholderiales bacterium]